MSRHRAFLTTPSEIYSRSASTPSSDFYWSMEYLQHRKTRIVYDTLPFQIAVNNNLTLACISTLHHIRVELHVSGFSIYHPRFTLQRSSTLSGDSKDTVVEFYWLIIGGELSRLRPILDDLGTVQNHQNLWLFCTVVFDTPLQYSIEIFVDWNTHHSPIKYCPGV